MKITFEPLGVIRSPYEHDAPFRPDADAEGEFIVQVNEEYEAALLGLDSFSHIIVFFHFNRSKKTNLHAHPPHMHGQVTGLFASRSPNRINKIGMNVVKILKIEGRRVYTSPMDILDQTPLLDIKPYVPALDCRPEANSGHTEQV